MIAVVIATFVICLINQVIGLAIGVRLGRQQQDGRRRRPVAVLTRPGRRRNPIGFAPPRSTIAEK